MPVSRLAREGKLGAEAQILTANPLNQSPASRFSPTPALALYATLFGQIGELAKEEVNLIELSGCKCTGILGTFGVHPDRGLQKRMFRQS